MDEEKFVLFLDILGFKDLINNNTVDEVKNIYDKQVIKTIGSSLQMASSIYRFPLTLNQFYFDISQCIATSASSQGTK